MKKLITLALLFTCLRIVAQPDPTLFPDSVIRSNGKKALRWKTMAFILQTGKNVDDSIWIKSQITLDKYGLTLSEPPDSISKTRYPGGAWVEKKDKSILSLADFDEIDSNLPPGSFIVPVYRFGKRMQGAFAALPHILVVDKSVYNNELGQKLKEAGMVIDGSRSKNLTTQIVFKIKRGKRNVIGIRNDILQDLGSIHKLKDHIRFENLPYLSELNKERQGQRLSVVNQWNILKINATPATFRNVPSVTVAVFDYGIDLTLGTTYPYLNLDRGTNLSTGDGSPIDESSHGTKVAGIIGMNTNPAQILGICPGIKIVPIARVTQTDTEVAEGIGYCLRNNVAVVNMSFGRFPEQGGEYEMPWDFDAIDPAIEDAHNRGLIMVAASGNNYITDRITYPARNPFVIAVGASGHSDKLISMSNYGDSVYHYGRKTGISVVAPGEDIQTTDLNGDFVTDFGGTSAATAHVSSLAALILSEHPGVFNNEQVRTIIESTAVKIDRLTIAYSSLSDFPHGDRSQETGYGRINIGEALRYATNITSPLTPQIKAEIASVAWANGTEDILTEDDILVVTLKKKQVSQKAFAAIVKRGQAIGFNRYFSGSESVLNLTSLPHETADTVFKFKFTRMLLDSLSENDSDWEAVAVGRAEGQPSDYPDVRSEIATGNASVYLISFSIADPPNYRCWIIGGIIVAVVIFLIWLFRRRRS